MASSDDIELKEILTPKTKGADWWVLSSVPHRQKYGYGTALQEAHMFLILMKGRLRYFNIIVSN